MVFIIRNVTNLILDILIVKSFSRKSFWDEIYGNQLSILNIKFELFSLDKSCFIMNRHTSIRQLNVYLRTKNVSGTID